MSSVLAKAIDVTGCGGISAIEEYAADDRHGNYSGSGLGQNDRRYVQAEKNGERYPVFPPRAESFSQQERATGQIKEALQLNRYFESIKDK